MTTTVAKYNSIFRHEWLQIVVDGYCRQNYDQFIPSVIVDLLITFYNAVIYCHLFGKNLTNFISYKTGKPFMIKTFQLQGIEFEYKIFPNGHKLNDHGYITFYISVSFWPMDMMGVTMYYEFFCNELNYRIKKIHTFSKYSNKWYPLQLYLSELIMNNSNTINLNCFMDILRIKYNNNINKAPWDQLKTLKMTKKIDYKWIVDDKFRKKLKLKKRFYSNTFDNCWCLYCDVNGIYLQLLKLPVGISKVQIKYSFFVGNKSEIRDGDSFSYYSTDRTIFYSSVDINADIIVEYIEIIGIYDMTDQEIDKNDWHLYLNL